jgi:hypothetical protein
MVVFLVDLEMVREVADPFGQESDLDLGRPGICVMQAILLDDRPFLFSLECQLFYSSSGPVGRSINY